MLLIRKTTLQPIGLYVYCRHMYTETLCSQLVFASCAAVLFCFEIIHRHKPQPYTDVSHCIYTGIRKLNYSKALLKISVQGTSLFTITTNINEHDNHT